jgi:hypothetical protein
MTGKTDGNIWVEGLSGGYDSAILANPGVSYQVVARLLASPGHMAAPRFQPALVSKMGCCARRKRSRFRIQAEGKFWTTGRSAST